jgi:hypothetical protein
LTKGKIDCKENGHKCLYRNLILNVACPEDAVDCCHRVTLANQPDFKEQMPQVKEILSSSGHLVVFLPKFHPECNFIENIWGEAKRVLRNLCDFTLPGLRKNIPVVLENISLSLIRKYHRKAMRFVDAYGKGYSLKLAQFQTKIYKGHRGVPNITEQQLEDEKNDT